jgi:hypothetical protein
MNDCGNRGKGGGLGAPPGRPRGEESPSEPKSSRGGIAEEDKDEEEGER